MHASEVSPLAWAEKLPSGKWRGSYRDAFGKPRSAGTFTHKAAAVRAANVKEDEARRSMQSNPDAHRQTWGEWCETWWPTRSVEPGTLKRDKSRLEVHLKPRWADVPLGQITRHDIKAWVAQLRQPDDDGKALANTTVQRIVHLMSASLVAAVDAEILQANPAARIKLPPAPPAKERYLDIGEYDELVDQLPTRQDRILTHFLAYLGPRIGEASGLHEHRLDLKRRQVTIAETFDEIMGDIKPMPKGKKSRVLPIPEWLAVELEWLLASRPAAKTCGLEHRSGACRSGLVFRTSTGTVVRRDNWDTTFRGALRAVNLGTDEEPVEMEPATIHDLRHTYASWMLADGTVTIQELAELMGHGSVTVTERYSHLAPRDNKRLLAALPAPRLLHAPAVDLESERRLRRSDVVGPVGLEPTTRGLKVRCSAN
jgi:integrase